ncbi:MAG: phenylalanine--tRNA ligase subunit beta [Candidatus Vogelbacteria bacterium]|nr:phenylalanine--tRNA ligase subunit beta [Candidatus Vogelbacteria bacterium]
MNISYEWLQSFFAEPLPEIRELAGLLTAHAYEVEEIAEESLVIDILPNRGHDSLCHLGVAREIAVLLDREIVMPSSEANIAYDIERMPTLLTLRIPEDGLVRRASKRVIKNVTVGDSSEWMKRRLVAIGQRSINNIVDATNYVTFEMGQPVHAFDYDKIAGMGAKNIYIRHARDNEKIVLLDGIEYSLEPSMLVIADDAGALDVAGVKGGARAAIDKSTKNVLLSVCNFNATNIRKTSDRLKLVTDAAKRFRQELTTELVGVGIERLTTLVIETSGGQATKDILDEYPHKAMPVEISASVHETNALLGTTLVEQDMALVLQRMTRAGFRYRKEDDRFFVSIPAERLDLMNPGRGEWSGGVSADLIEEIGRIVGYDRIAEVAPSSVLIPRVLKKYYYSELIRQTLISCGFSEVYTYSFVGDGDTDAHVAIENPIADNKRFMRHELSHSLEQKLDENIKNADLLGIEQVKIFEIGNVFNKDREWTTLAMCGGDKNGKKLNIEPAIHVLNDTLGAQCEPMRSGRCAEIDLTMFFDKLSEPANYEDLVRISAEHIVYEPISQYPFITRDIAVWMPEGADSTELESLIAENDTALKKRVTLFDSYTKNGRTSYAYRIVFQAPDRTLTDDEVNALMAPLYASAARKEGWEIR